MVFLTVSDEVVPAIYSLNIKERFRGIDGVLGCGDLPPYYLEFIITLLAKPCFYVDGNHNGVEYSEDGEDLHAPRGCVSIERHCVFHEGLLIAGLGGSIRYNQEPGAQYTEAQMLTRVWALAPRLLINQLRYGRYLDIMLTHAPPLGIHNGPDFPHRGFRAFLTLMDFFKPRYLIHGHIHRSYGFSAVTETYYKQTTVLNTAGYRLLTIDAPASGDRPSQPK